MQFKIAIILFAINLVTVTRSIGLNKYQVQKVSIFFEEHEKPLSKIPKAGCNKLANDFGKKIVQLLRPSANKILMRDMVKLANEFEMKNVSYYFKYNKDASNNQKVQDLLVYLASYDKGADDWRKTPSLTSYEVRILLGLFNEFNIYVPHASRHHLLIACLNLHKSVKYSLLAVLDVLLGEGGGAINAAKFLEGYLNIKPQGKGLDVNQVQKLISLHKNHKTDDDHIKPVEITKLFNKLSIVTEDHKNRLIFPSIRSAALELEELLIVTVEYDNEVDVKTSSVLSTTEVRSFMWMFSTHDKNKNGLLGEAELTGITTTVSALIAKFDSDGDQHINIAEYFMMIFGLFIDETIKYDIHC
ncbi:uncharacterized protein LOC126837377 [Adelges cooleyi]|uniref:uncharacterized protein LOC126837377 n=1 Tax=Adelges cooleyi TaxID=133065 RepID=UPI00217F8502|nr:uncharacterized protein LOC126837377 [Adelges cooleyi]